MKTSFIDKKQSEDRISCLGDNKLNHIAIIMDGNGRWAQKRGMPRVAGHKEGLTTVVKVVKSAVKCKVKYLTLYTFSTENWKRPKSEIDFILKLPMEFLNRYLPELIANNVRIETIGDVAYLPVYTRKALQYATKRTRNNDGLQLNFALNYGSRHEILLAMKEMYLDINHAKLSLDNVDEQLFSQYLNTAGMPEPDLLIRTGGEKRLSNFLLWQLAYTEFWFTDVLWPDFSEEEFMRALDEYQQRKRRFGGI
ncbi:isoprenyl transferase [Sporolactobacillus terrae]|uniref:Isoprenyl transferase n=1 Tax=Sporolactobacillus terrae TaxID=269673 RepID=A0A410DBE2_9BACL|nr:isoprenyl transferase [Sporolactobacillus terrae]QAA23393.1 isoprenyl transferase [Sporolactobacillus terrae]QAA26364.1 isoprenyl transferase [Sporolactobacillus terrae]UAK15458.1 isoprenyl transferase [Sporolactobacillus terrae]BBN99821.1 isoprenyl transferase [Sporolactobacillus terrae]